MSKRNKGGKGLRPDKMLERAQRELARGNTRQALKEAKVCFRTAATDDHRQFLERAYAARIEDLVKAGLQDQAKANLDELLKLGPTVFEVQQKVPKLQLLLGAAGSQTTTGSAPSLEAHPELVILVADQAVLHPNRGAPPAEIRRDAEAVRAALEAVERGDETAVAERLNGIARQSPLADWKLFARGLAAFYERQPDRCRANWDRLDPQRPASRIAQTLLVFSGETDAAEAQVAVAQRVRRLGYALEGGNVSESLRQLADHFRADRWNELLQAFRSFRQRYGQTQGVLIDKITDLLWKRFVRDGLAKELERLAGIAPAPALDPRWNRARALLAEHNEHVDLSQLEERWNACIQDLSQVSELREEERDIAAALVYLRFARGLAEHAKAARFGTLLPLPGFQSHRDAGRTVDRAVDYFRASQKRYPRLYAAHQELAELYLQMDDPDSAAAAFADVLKHYPDDYDALVWLAVYHLDRDQPAKAEPYIDRALRLKPRDPHTLNLLWNHRLSTARHATKKRQFALARQMLDAAAQVRPAGVDPANLDAARAAIEYKAQNTEQAERYGQAVLAQLEEPTAAWLFMSCLAARWGLPKPVKKDFDARLKEALRGPANGRTAGRMARYLLPLLQRRVKSTEYVGRATHQRLVVDYLRRCRNVRWEREDLRAVCEFLTTDEGWRTQSLLREFVALGVKQFPNEPLFHYLAGESEMKQGPLMVNAEVAQRCLQRALDLDRQDGGSLGASFRDRAKQSLALLDSLSHTARGMFDDEDDEDYEDWEYFDEDDEEDDYDEDYGPGSGFSGRYYSEDELRRALPPPMFEILKQQAQQMGVSIGELASRIGQFASQFGSGQEDYDDEDFGPPRRGRRRPVRR